MHIEEVEDLAEDAQRKSDEEKTMIDAAIKNMPRCALESFNAAQRPTIHISLHFITMLEEYARTVNCNVLLGKNKHR